MHESRIVRRRRDVAGECFVLIERFGRITLQDAYRPQGPKCLKNPHYALTTQDS